MIRSTFYGFSTALSGMMASQNALDVTGNNMANVNTDGYTRQRLDVDSIAPSMGNRYASKNSFAVGQGVTITGISQIRDPFLDIRFRAEACGVGELDAWLGGMQDVSSTFDEVQQKAFLGALTDFRTQLQKLSGASNQKEMDTIVRSAAETLTKQLNQYANQLTTIRHQQEYDLQNSSIPKINDILDNIAKLNQSITEAEISGNPALELKDHRNGFLDQLSTYMKINVEYTPVQISDNVTVDKMTIRFAEDPSDPMKFNIPGGIDDIDTKSKGYMLIDGDQHATLSVEKDKDGVTQILSDWANANLAGPAGGSKPVALTFASGSLKGITDLLNKNGEFDSEANSPRGIGYYEKMLDVFARDFANTMNKANLVKNPDYDAALGESPDNREYLGGPLFTTSTAPADPTKLYHPNDPDYYDDSITAANIGVSQNWLSGQYGITNTSRNPGDADTGTDNSGANDNILYMISLLDDKRIYNASNVIQNASAAVQAVKGTYEAAGKLPNISAGVLNNGDTISFSVNYDNQKGQTGQKATITLTYRDGFLYGANGSKYPAVTGTDIGHPVNGDKLTDAIAGELSKAGDFRDNFTVSKGTDGKLVFTAKAGGIAGGKVTGMEMSHTNFKTASTFTGSASQTNGTDAFHTLNFGAGAGFQIYDSAGTDAEKANSIFTINGQKYAFAKKGTDIRALSKDGIRAVELDGTAVAEADVERMAIQMRSAGLTVNSTAGSPLQLTVVGETLATTNTPAGFDTKTDATKGVYQSGGVSITPAAENGDQFGLSLLFRDDKGDLQKVNLNLTYQTKDAAGTALTPPVLAGPDGRTYPAAGTPLSGDTLLSAIRNELSAHNPGIAANFDVTSAGGKLSLTAKTPGTGGASVQNLELNMTTERTSAHTLPGGVAGTVTTATAPEDGYQTSDLSQFTPYDGTNAEDAVFTIGGKSYAFVPSGSTAASLAGVTTIPMTGTGTTVTAGDVTAFINKLGPTAITQDGGGTSIKLPLDQSVTKGSSRELFNGTFDQFFSSVGITAGQDVSSKSSELKNNINLLNGASSQRDSVSTVDLNEEGANLLRFQKSFTAAARLLTALDEALDTVINKMGIVGR